MLVTVCCAGDAAAAAAPSPPPGLADAVCAHSDLGILWSQIDGGKLRAKVGAAPQVPNHLLDHAVCVAFMVRTQAAPVLERAICPVALEAAYTDV